MDDKAILDGLLERNALRRAAHLPLLNLEFELDHAIQVARWQEACEAHADDRLRLHEEVIADLQSRHGKRFGQSVGGHWVIEFEVARRFNALLADDGVLPPQEFIGWLQRRL
jgi:hypothetical protein